MEEEINIDDFLPLESEDIVDSGKDDKPSLFSDVKEADLAFLEDEEGAAAPEEDIEDVLDEKLVTSTSGRKKIEKSGLVSVVNDLIKDNIFLPFDEDKPLEDYTVQDFKDLIKANIEEKEKAIRETTPKEFFEALPDELKYAAEYVAKGGSDMKGLFKALAYVEEYKDLDPANDSHQEMIVRQYLQATNFAGGDQALIEEQLQEWADTNLLGKKATQFKPKLNEMNEQIVKNKIKQQEDFKKIQDERREAYMQNIYAVLKPGELNGVKLDAKTQNLLWEGLTSARHDSISGKKTNMLGKLLEEYQFGEKPRYDLIAEALWLFTNPEEYKNHIKDIAKKEEVAKTVRTLKTEEKNSKNKMNGHHEEEESKTQTRKTLSRKQINIFAKQ